MFNSHNISFMTAADLIDDNTSIVDHYWILLLGYDATFKRLLISMLELFCFVIFLSVNIVISSVCW